MRKIIYYLLFKRNYEGTNVYHLDLEVEDDSLKVTPKPQDVRICTYNITQEIAPVERLELCHFLSHTKFYAAGNARAYEIIFEYWPDIGRQNVRMGTVSICYDGHRVKCSCMDVPPARGNFIMNNQHW